MTAEIQDHPGFVPCTGITDEEIMAKARAAMEKVPSNLKALKGKSIVWVCPYRKEGVIELAWDFRPNSCEAVMVSDDPDRQVPKGTMCMVRPDEGFLHTVNGVELCFMPASAVMLLQENE